jgi:GTP-binding protein
MVTIFLKRNIRGTVAEKGERHQEKPAVGDGDEARFVRRLRRSALKRGPSPLLTIRASSPWYVLPQCFLVNSRPKGYYIQVRILEVGFIRSVTGIEQRKGLQVPEVCFMGRSNVGKSSLLNTLAMRKIARTGSTPGATKLINLYDVRYERGGTRKSMIFSDFPGFGYSKVSKQVYENWQSMVEGYMTQNEWIRRVLWVFDVRRDMDDLDYVLLDWFKDKAIPFSLVVTKADKEGRGKSLHKRSLLQKAIGNDEVFLFSSKDGSGRKELLFHIGQQLDPALS